VRASATGDIQDMISAERKKRGGFKMWFKPTSRRIADQTIGQLEAVAKVPPLPRAELMLEKSGVLAVAEGKSRTSWVIYPIRRGRPLESMTLKGDLEPRLRDKKVLGQIKERVGAGRDDSTVA